MRLISVSKTIRCGKCQRTIGEDLGYFILVRHRGVQVRFYGPGIVAIDCRSCGHTKFKRLKPGG